MNFFSKLTALVVIVALVLSFASCVDLGAGENEDDFKKYFSGVYVLSANGLQKYLIDDFNTDIDMEDMDIPVVVPNEEYCYIGFRVANGYTVSLSEFAFFVRTASGEGALELEFYIVDKMPSSIKGEDGEDLEVPPIDEEENPPEEGGAENGGAEEGGAEEGGTETEPDPDLSEEDVFVPEGKFHDTVFHINENWESVLLEFDGAKTATSKQFVVVRIKNNCNIQYNEEEESEEEQIPAVSFTFNYLLFHFTDAHKE